MSPGGREKSPARLRLSTVENQNASEKLENSIKSFSTPNRSLSSQKKTLGYFVE